MNAARILEASNVAWHVGSDTILDQVSLALHEGEILTVIRPNGAAGAACGASPGCASATCHSAW